MSDRPHRLPDFPYTGLHRYSLTFCTHQRRELFTDAAVVEEAVGQILQAAVAHDFAVIAYCFMPDHLHLLVQANSESADLLAFANLVKQRIAYYYRRTHQVTVWQKSYYEHVVRDDETTHTIAKYILENPVRGGLVREPLAYPFSGSSVWTREQMQELWQADVPEFEAASTDGTP